MEIFKEIEGYENYQVSNLGNVKSLGNGKDRILKPQKDRYGYLYVNLFKQRKRKFYLIHRLVASAFIENPNNLPQVNHKDENKTNNKVDNLEFCTAKYNIDYSQSKQVLCVETGVVYPSTNQVERELGFAHSNISSACKGKLKTAYKFHWEYVYKKRVG